jgi:hypothetical protein
VCGSGEVVCSLFLLIRWAQRARCQAETPLIVLCRFLRPALEYRPDRQERANSPFSRVLGHRHWLKIKPGNRMMPTAGFGAAGFLPHDAFCLKKYSPIQLMLSRNRPSHESRQAGNITVGSLRPCDSAAARHVRLAGVRGGGRCDFLRAEPPRCVLVDRASTRALK